MKDMRAILAGVPGVGKSTVLDLVKGMVPDLEVYNLGDLMLDEAMRRGLVSSRDEIRSLEPEEILDLRRKALSRVRGTKVILDTHLSVRTSSGFLPGVTQEVLNIFKPHLILVREDEPRVIASRRSLDRLTGSRTGRDVESEEDIAEHQEVNRAIAFACSVLTGCPVRILRGDAGSVASEIARLMG